MDNGLKIIYKAALKHKRPLRLLKLASPGTITSYNGDVYLAIAKLPSYGTVYIRKP